MHCQRPGHVPVVLGTGAPETCMNTELYHMCAVQLCVYVCTCGVCAHVFVYVCDVCACASCAVCVCVWCAVCVCVCVWCIIYCTYILQHVPPTRMHACTHTRTHARTHARTHMHTHNLYLIQYNYGFEVPNILLFVITQSLSKLKLHFTFRQNVNQSWEV